MDGGRRFDSFEKRNRLVHRYPAIFQLRPGTSLITIPVSHFELTRVQRLFEQILALFIAVPPFLQVCQLIPQIWPWFINLTWVTCCWKRKREAKQLTLMEEPDPSYTMAYYTQLEDPVSSEVRNSQFDEGRKESQGSGMRLGPNRYYGS